MFLLSFACWVISIAYLVLISEMLVPAVKYISDIAITSSEAIIAVGCVISPFCCFQSLNALRPLSVVSVFTVFFIIIIIGLKAVEMYGTHDVYYTDKAMVSVQVQVQDKFRMFPASVWDAFYVTPVYMVSYFCHYNVTSALASLSVPTLFRSRAVCVVSCVVSTAVYLLAGVFGYVYAADETCGNILSNFAPNDTLAMLCRCAFTCVLTLNLPLVVLPARDTFYSLTKFVRRAFFPTARDSPAGSPHGSSGDDGNLPFLEAYVSASPVAKPKLFDQFVPHDAVFLEGAQDSAAMTFWLRVTFSLFLLAAAVAVACTVRSILTVWGILGSAIAMTIMVIQPPLWWNQICENSKSKVKRFFAVVLAVFGMIFAVICTVLTVIRIANPSCPSG